MVKGRAARRLPEVLLALLALSLWSGAAAPAATETAAEDLQLAAVLEHPVPESLDELRIIEDRVREIADKVLPATVSVQVGTASGSGVVIHDGYVLTAGHVCGRPGREARVIFPDGKVARGVTLGVNTKIDSG